MFYQYQWLHQQRLRDIYRNLDGDPNEYRDWSLDKMPRRQKTPARPGNRASSSFLLWRDNNVE
jgi:hypothetical protein